MAAQQQPSLQARPLLPSLSSLSRLCHSPPSPQQQHLSTYNSSRSSPHSQQLPSCSVLASTCPPMDFPPPTAAYPSPSPSLSTSAVSLPPVSSIAPLLHACSAASHAMGQQQQQQQEELKPHIKQEDATLTSISAPAGPFSPATLYGEASRRGGTLGSSASFLGGAAEGPWQHQQHQQVASAAGSSGSFCSAAAPMPLGGEVEEGRRNSKGKGKSEDGDVKIKSASPDSVGSGEGGAGAGGKTLKQTKRAAQNREAQRAFRSRKEQYIKELEQTSTLYSTLLQTHESLTHRLTSLESSLTCLESDRARFESERAAFEAERSGWERERKLMELERGSWAEERRGWEGERRKWKEERGSLRDNAELGPRARRELEEQEEEEGMSEQEEDSCEEGEGEKSRLREEARMALRRELELDAASAVRGERAGSAEREGKRMRVE